MIPYYQKMASYHNLNDSYDDNDDNDDDYDDDTYSKCN